MRISDWSSDVCSSDLPAHPVRLTAEEMLASLSADLQNDSDTRARVERMTLEVIDNPPVAPWLAGLWDTARAGLLRRWQSFAPAPARSDERRGGKDRDRRGKSLWWPYI